MQQFDLLAGVPPLPPLEVGHACAKACTEAAERRVEFDTDGARKFIHGWLVRHGRASGEALVDAAKQHGYVPHDDRAFGSVFGVLVKRKLARCVGYAPRRKGHGVIGAKVYEAVG